MTKFIYKGPLAAVTIKDGREARDIILSNGKEIDLPEKNGFVRTLIEKGRLIAVVETKKKGG